MLVNKWYHIFGKKKKKNQKKETNKKSILPVHAHAADYPKYIYRMLFPQLTDTNTDCNEATGPADASAENKHEIVQ